MIEKYIEVNFGETWTTWEGYEDRYGMAEHPKDEAKVWAVAIWGQTLGTIVRKNLVDIKTIYKHYSTIIIQMWERLEPMIIGSRKAYNQPKQYEAFEWLVKQFKKMQEEESKGKPIKLFIEMRDEQKKVIQLFREERGKDQQESNPT